MTISRRNVNYWSSEQKPLYFIFNVANAILFEIVHDNEKKNTTRADILSRTKEFLKNGDW